MVSGRKFITGSVQINGCAALGTDIAAGTAGGKVYSTFQSQVVCSFQINRIAVNQGKISSLGIRPEASGVRTVDFQMCGNILQGNGIPVKITRVISEERVDTGIIAD